ncbi:MAG TPA: hypothetical protein ENI23_08490 [bacterium]|nr:hypothetical protein [bacterium]
MIQTATTGNLASAQRIVIEQIRYTAEHSAPVINLVEKLRLAQGEKSITVPKVGQFTAADLTDGVDLVDTQDIGMTTTTLTTAEVGLKIILTDKLTRQANEDMFRVIGRQAGDAMARKKDTDLIALFTAFGGSLGTAGASLTLQNLTGCIDFAKRNKFPAPVYAVQHPSTLFDVSLNSTIIPSLTQGLPHGLDEKLLKDFYKFMVNQVAVFEDGNISIDGSDDAIGAIFSKNAACYIESVGYDGRQQRDESLRATEQIVLADYGVFELDDGYGASMTYDAAANSTTA